MDEESVRREKILIELKSIIKQVYHEAVNHELSQDNINYITQSLFKRLEETLFYGLKQQQHGYWKILHKVLHPDTLTQLNDIPGMTKSNLNKGRTWIPFALKEDSFVSYINCFVLEKHIAKLYEDWSIIRHNDSCNAFLSLLSGLESVSFNYELIDALCWPTYIKLMPRIISGNTVVWSPASSLTDSGVQLDRSEDYINGNIPSAAVVLRKRVKDTQRHVSFHEDSLAKSPSGRKLRWDDENSRYSWAGEELDALKLPGLGNTRSSLERGAPEGEESPSSRADNSRVAVNVAKRPFTSTKHVRRLKSRKFAVDFDDIIRFTDYINDEMSHFQDRRRKNSLINYEVELPDKLNVILGLVGVKVQAYKMWGKMVILASDRLIILHRDLHTVILTLLQIQQIVVFPHAHEIHLLTRKQTHVLRCGDRNLAHEVLTRLAFNLHRVGSMVHFRILQPEDMTHLKQELINLKVLTEESVINYMGLVRLQANEEKYSNSESFEKQGCLMFCTARGQNWQPVNCVLRGGVLYLYGENRSTLAEINLLTSCAGCERSIFPDRPHTFTLSLNHPLNFNNSINGFYQDLALKADATSTPSKTSQWAGSALSKLTNGKPASEAFGQWLTGILRPETPITALYFATADEYETSDWLQAFLTVLCNRNEETQSETKECNLLLTEDTIVLFTHTVESQDGFRVMASGLINDISAFNYGCHVQDSYGIIELECMEAGCEASDLALHFGSKKELKMFIRILEGKHVLNPINDARCERTQDCLAREWFA